jgi:hypothetical protein
MIPIDFQDQKSKMVRVGKTPAGLKWINLPSTTISASNNIRLVTNTIMSPTAKKAIAEFSAKYPSVKVVTYDPVSASALLDANEQRILASEPFHHIILIRLM